MNYKIIKNHAHVQNILDIPGFNEELAFFYDTRDPNSGDDSYVNSLPFGTEFMCYWWNQTSGDIFQMTNWGNTPLVWTKFANNQNVLAMLNSAGWLINTSRSYSQRSSPAFSTSYTPSTTNDTQVIAVISLTSTVLLAAQVNIQVNTGSGFSTIAEEGLSGLAATSVRSITFTVPANASYQLVSVSGSTSITQIKELSE